MLQIFPARKTLQQGREIFLQANAEVCRKLLAEKRRHGANSGIDKMLVVIENHNEVSIQVPGLVQPLKSKPGAQPAVADNRDDFARRTLQGIRFDHAQRGGNRGSRMARAEDIIFALLAAQKTADAAVLPNSGKPLAAATEKLV